MKRRHPLTEGDVGTLEDRSDGYGELLAAVPTLKQPGAPLEAGYVPQAALGALNAMRPTEAFQVCPRLIFSEPREWHFNHINCISLYYNYVKYRL